MNHHFYKYDYAIRCSGKIIEKHALVSQSPVAVTNLDLLTEATAFLHANDCLVEVSNIQEIETQEDFIELGGSSEGIVTNYAAGNENRFVDVV